MSVSAAGLPACNVGLEARTGQPRCREPRLQRRCLHEGQGPSRSAGHQVFRTSYSWTRLGIGFDDRLLLTMQPE